MLIITGHGIPGTVAPVDPFALPSSPFGPSLAWVDTTSAPNFQFYDPSLSSPTLTFMEDLTGQGNGFGQLTKSLQPAATSGNAPDFGAGTYLMCVNCLNWQGQSDGQIFNAYNSFLNGIGQLTIGAAFNLDSSFSGGVNRFLFSLQGDMINISFTTADKLSVGLRPLAGGAHFTSSTSVSAISRGANHQLVANVDLTQSPSPINIYLDGALYDSETFTFAVTTFQPASNQDMYLGNSQIGGTDNPLTGKLGKFVAINGIVSGIGTPLQTYLAGAWT